MPRVTLAGKRVLSGIPIAAEEITEQLAEDARDFAAITKGEGTVVIGAIGDENDDLAWVDEIDPDQQSY